MEGGKSTWINVICLSRLCLSIDVSENKFCDQFMQKCVLNLFPVTVLYKRLLQHTQKHCGKQMHEASGNHFRHLTWYFTIVFFMFFKCQNSALRFAPAWTCVYISGTTHVRKDFHVYVCVKTVTGCWLCVEGSGQISFQLECYYVFGASINVTVRKHHWGNFSKCEAQADGWGTAKNRGPRGTEHGKSNTENNTMTTNTTILLFQFTCYFREIVILYAWSKYCYISSVMFSSPSYCEISLAHI